LHINILFLLTDDQRFDMIGALNPEVKTPNIDNLVKRGTTFTHCFIMGGTQAAICAPSRAMLMTGRNLFNVPDSIVEIPGADDPSLATLPETLKNAGYETFMTGKWHSSKKTFKRSFTGGSRIFFGGMSNHLQMPIHDFDPTGEYPKEKLRIEKKFSSELFSDSAVDFLKNYRGDKPFFAYVAYTSPHDPRMAPKKYCDYYRNQDLKLPSNFLPEHPFDNGELKIRDELLAPFPRTPEVIKEHLAAYYAMVSEVDAQIGRVLDALKESGHDKDTIIVFGSDNGLAVGQHGLMGKQSLYEHSLRVPLIICGPGLPEGQKSGALVHLHDVFPTLCELLKMKTPPTVQSSSLVPVLKNQTAKVRDRIVGAYINIQRCVREEEWKLIVYRVKGKETIQLFNIKDDPWETDNLSVKPEFADRISRMREQLIEWS
jgi:arylsulfatase A-like enzyme